MQGISDLREGYLVLKNVVPECDLDRLHPVALVAHLFSQTP